MTAPPTDPTGPVLLAAAAGTLLDLERSLADAGIPVVRFDALRFQPCLPPRTVRRIRRSSWDGIIVSSPRGLELFLAPVFGPAPRGRPAPVAFVAGESTALGAAELGYPVVRPAGPPGVAGIAAAVPAGRRLRLLHPRSDVAGPGLARLLRARGHTVRDVVAFRTVAATRMPSEVRTAAREARAVVVSSPSAVRSLRRHLGRPGFLVLAATRPFHVLGETTARAVRHAGARDVRLLDPGPSQAFDRAKMTSLFDGPRRAG